jgi:hypothetical protein
MPEQTFLARESRHRDESRGNGHGPPSPSGKGHAAGGLITLAGILAFLGCVMITAGTLDAWVISLNFGGDPAYDNPLIPWGIVLVGFGVAVGLIGAELKRESRESKLGRA